jgi:hypothetical protein
MNQLENPAIYVVKALWAYVSPIDRYRNLDVKFDNKTRNLTDKTKITLSKVYLTFFLCCSFTLIWLAYYDLKSSLEALGTFRPQDCGIAGGSCSDTWLSGYVKQNSFKISTILEVLFLVVGVVVGNIGWDQAAKIKDSGLEKIYNFFNVTVIILAATFVISIICNDVVDIIQSEYYYRYSVLERLLPALIFLVFFVGINVYYVRKKT